MGIVLLTCAHEDESRVGLILVRMREQSVYHDSVLVAMVERVYCNEAEHQLWAAAEKEISRALSYISIL